jgi:hypothetical protein
MQKGRLYGLEKCRTAVQLTELKLCEAAPRTFIEGRPIGDDSAANTVNRSWKFCESRKVGTGLFSSAPFYWKASLRSYLDKLECFSL